MKMHAIVLMVVSLGLAHTDQTNGATVVSFPPSDYSSNTAAMDQTLGITGYTIEGFESTTLIQGLSITLSGFDNGAPNETLTSLPQLYNPGNDSPNLSNNLWDGTHALNNTPNNGSISSYGGNPPVATTTTFSFAGGASSVGIGLSNFQSLSGPEAVTNHTLYINGVAQPGTLESIVGSDWTPGIVRNAYIRIDAAPGQTIDSIGFGNIMTIGAFGDFLVFDHLAVQSVPEPPGLTMLSLGALGIFGYSWSRRGRKDRSSHTSAHTSGSDQVVRRKP